MATWIISAILLVAIIYAAKYCLKKFRSGECIGCDSGSCNCSSGCCHCHPQTPDKTK